KIWDGSSGACLQTLEGHDDLVTSVVFSADGQRLASSSHDKTIKIWDGSSGACLQTLDVGRVITRLSFDPMTNSRLSTDVGALNLDLHSANAAQLTKASLLDCSHYGYGVSTDGIWIVKDRKRLLWLPPEFRALQTAVAGLTVALGCISGRVSLMQFSVI
ncbi:WD40-repeat-containing domain protein, partial [Dactylonectria estremocensis]